MNVAKCIGYIEDKHPIIVMEYLPNDTLTRYIEQQQDIDIKIILKIALGMAQGMNYLHTRKPDKVVHRDLKSSNVMVFDFFLNIINL